MRSFLCEGSDIPSFPDEVYDLEVAHLVELIRDDFPFELNTWRGGVKAIDARQWKGVGGAGDVGPSGMHGEDGSADGGLHQDHIVRVAADAFVAQALLMFEGYVGNMKREFGREIGDFKSDIVKKLHLLDDKLAEFGTLLTNISVEEGRGFSSEFPVYKSPGRDDQGRIFCL